MDLLFDFDSHHSQSGPKIVIDVESFFHQRLDGGFVIVEIDLTHQTLEDPLGREAVAQTRIVGREFRLTIRAGLSDEELSATLYHEILESATVASSHPPEVVCGLNEAGFEVAAWRAHNAWGEASVENLNRMLQFYGFSEE
jgi:hypothetical protein